MSLYVLVIGALLIQGGLHVWVSVVHRRQWMAHIEQKESEWISERKDLLDRIQAPSYAEYTSKVIREKKAEQPKEEEEPVEFVS